MCHVADKRLYHVDKSNNIELHSGTNNCFNVVLSHNHGRIIAYSLVSSRTTTNKDLEEDEQVSMMHAEFNIKSFGA
jgi:hypothetical protein